MVIERSARFTEEALSGMVMGRGPQDYRSPALKHDRVEASMQKWVTFRDVRIPHGPPCGSIHPDDRFPDIHI